MGKIVWDFLSTDLNSPVEGVEHELSKSDDLCGPIPAITAVDEDGKPLIVDGSNDLTGHRE